MHFVGPNNSNLPPACRSLWSVLARSYMRPANAFLQLSVRPKASMRTALRAVCRPAVDPFPRKFFLPPWSQNSRNWLLLLSFWFNFYTFFSNRGSKIPSDTFFLNFGVHCLPFLRFHLKINLVIIAFFGWCLLCEKPLLWGALLSWLLPSLILIFQPYFIEFLCIAKRYLPILCSKFFPVLNIFKPVIWGR